MKKTITLHCNTSRKNTRDICEGLVASLNSGDCNVNADYLGTVTVITIDGDEDDVVSAHAEYIEEQVEDIELIKSYSVE